MSSAILISEFNRVVGQHITLDQLHLRYQNNAQVIHVTGWHADGTPLAFVSAEFDGDPVLRVQQIAADLVRLHTGKPMAVPTTITEMASGFQRKLADADARSQKVMGDFTNHMSMYHAGLDEVEKTNAVLQKAGEDLRAVVGLGNGGPVTGS